MTTSTIAEMDFIASTCSQPYGFWLDSAVVDKRLGSTSLCASDPYLILRSKGDDVELWERGGTCHTEASPFEVLRYLLHREQRSPEGGVVGYFSYDLRRHVETLPGDASDDLRLPDCYLCFYDRISRLDPRLTAAPSSNGAERTRRPDLASLESTFTPQAYRRAVEQAKRYIFDGDIYQVNLSQRFQAPLRQEAFRPLPSAAPA